MKTPAMNRGIAGIVALGLLLAALTGAAQPTREQLQDSIRCQTARIAYNLALRKTTTKKKRLCGPKLSFPTNFASLKQFVDKQTFCNDADVSSLKSLVAYLSAWEMPTAGPATAEIVVPTSIMALPVFNQKDYKNKRSVIETQLRGYVARKVEAHDWDGLKAEDGMFGRIRYAIQQNGVPVGGETAIFVGLLLLGGGGVYFLLRKPKVAKQLTGDNRQQKTEDRQPKAEATPPREDVAPEAPTPVVEKPVPTQENTWVMPEIQPLFLAAEEPVAEQNPTPPPAPPVQERPAPKPKPTQSVLEPPKLYNPHLPELREERKESGSGLVMPWEQPGEGKKKEAISEPLEKTQGSRHEATPDSPLQTSDSPLPTPDFKLQAPDSQIPQTPDSGLQTPNAKLSTPDSPLQTPDSFPEPVACLYFGFPDENGVFAQSRPRYAPGRTYIEMNVLPGEKTAYFTLCEEMDTSMARNLVLQWAGIAPVCYANGLSDTLLRFETTRPGLADLVNGNWVCTRKAAVRCVEA